MKKILTYLSFAINILIILAIVFILAVKGPDWFIGKIKNASGTSGNVLTLDDRHYKTKSSLYRKLNYTQNQKKIIFLGDSLTENGNWSELFQSPNILNRGIQGDTTVGILKRTNDVAVLKPTKIFIMAGINDLSKGSSANSVFSNYERIIKTIKSKSPHTKIYVQSTLPINNKKNGGALKPSAIVNFDKDLKNLSEKNDAAFIDLYPLFVDGHGYLKSNLTYDGTHVNGDGYVIWKNAIEKYVQ